MLKNAELDFVLIRLSLEFLVVLFSQIIVKVSIAGYETEDLVFLLFSQGCRDSNFQT